MYPDAVGDKDKMRAHILRERQVELCFEADRYYTLTRRLLAGLPKYTTIYGLDVNANDNGLGFSLHPVLQPESIPAAVLGQQDVPVPYQPGRY